MMGRLDKAGIFAVVVLTILTPPASAQSPPSIIMPPSPAPAPAPHHVNLTALLTHAGPFQTFLSYLEETKVIDTFQNQANNTLEGITIFVPKNSAFTALKKSTFANLTQEQLTSLVLYHALPRYYALSEFKNLSSLNPVTTFAGGQFSVNLTDNSGSIVIASMWSEPSIVSSVYATAPCAVYAIDKVLLPMQLFSTDPPLAPAPAPAPEAKASDVTASPKASEPKSTEETSSSYSVSVGARSFLLLAVSGGLMLLW